MSSPRVQQIAQEIAKLTETERQELATEILPLLLLTRGGIESIDQALHSLSDPELEALVARARIRNQQLSEQTITAVISEALQTARATRGS